MHMRAYLSVRSWDTPYGQSAMFVSTTRHDRWVLTESISDSKKRHPASHILSTLLFTNCKFTAKKCTRGKSAQSDFFSPCTFNEWLGSAHVCIVNWSEFPPQLWPVSSAIATLVSFSCDRRGSVNHARSSGTVHSASPPEHLPRATRARAKRTQVVERATPLQSRYSSIWPR